MKKQRANRLTEIRQKRGLTQTELAIITGLSPGYISHIETGEREPSKRTMEKIAEAVSSTPQDIFFAN